MLGRTNSTYSSDRYYDVSQPTEMEIEAAEDIKKGEWVEVIREGWNYKAAEQAYIKRTEAPTWYDFNSYLGPSRDRKLKGVTDGYFTFDVAGSPSALHYQLHKPADVAVVDSYMTTTNTQLTTNTFMSFSRPLSLGFSDDDVFEFFMFIGQYCNTDKNPYIIVVKVNHNTGEAALVRQRKIFTTEKYVITTVNDTETGETTHKTDITYIDSADKAVTTTVQYEWNVPYQFRDLEVKSSTSDTHTTTVSTITTRDVQSPNSFENPAMIYKVDDTHFMIFLTVLIKDVYYFLGKRFTYDYKTDVFNPQVFDEDTGFYSTFYEDYWNLETGINATCPKSNLFQIVQDKCIAYTYSSENDFRYITLDDDNIPTVSENFAASPWEFNRNNIKYTGYGEDVNEDSEGVGGFDEVHWDKTPYWARHALYSSFAFDGERYKWFPDDNENEMFLIQNNFYFRYLFDRATNTLKRESHYIGTPYVAMYIGTDGTAYDGDWKDQNIPYENNGKDKISVVPANNPKVIDATDGSNLGNISKLAKGAVHFKKYAEKMGISNEAYNYPLSQFNQISDERFIVTGWQPITGDLGNHTLYADYGGAGKGTNHMIPGYGMNGSTGSVRYATVLATRLLAFSKEFRTFKPVSDFDIFRGYLQDSLCTGGTNITETGNLFVKTEGNSYVYISNYSSNPCSVDEGLIYGRWTTYSTYIDISKYNTTYGTATWPYGHYRIYGIPAKMSMALNANMYNYPVYAFPRDNGILDVEMGKLLAISNTLTATLNLEDVNENENEMMIKTASDPWKENGFVWQYRRRRGTSNPNIDSYPGLRSVPKGNLDMTELYADKYMKDMLYRLDENITRDTKHYKTRYALGVAKETKKKGEKVRIDGFIDI